MIQHSIELYIFKNFKGMLSRMYCLIFFPSLEYCFFKLVFHPCTPPPPKKRKYVILLNILWVNCTLYICQDFIPVVST